MNSFYIFKILNIFNFYLIFFIKYYQKNILGGYNKSLEYWFWNFFGKYSIFLKYPLNNAFAFLFNTFLMKYYEDYEEDVLGGYNKIRLL